MRNRELLDAHIHLQGFGAGLRRYLARAVAAGCSVFITNSTTEHDWQQVLTVSTESGGQVRAFLGIHPWQVSREALQSLPRLEQLLADSSSGVGEIGLDRACEVDFGLQLELFTAQLELAQRYKRPLSLHSVRAQNEIILEIKGLRRGIPFMFHSFAGSPQQAGQIIDHGGLVSLAFSLLRQQPERVKKLLAYLPLSSILLESDAPEQRLPPVATLQEYGVAERVQTDGAWVIPELYAVVARLKGISLEALEEKVWENYQRFSVGL